MDLGFYCSNGENVVYDMLQKYPQTVPTPLLKG